MITALWAILILYGFSLVLAFCGEHQRRKEHKARRKKQEERERKAALTYETRDQFWNKLMH